MNTTTNRKNRRRLAAAFSLAVALPVGLGAGFASPASAGGPFGPGIPEIDFEIPTIDPCTLIDCDPPKDDTPVIEIPDYDGPIIEIPCGVLYACPPEDTTPDVPEDTTPDVPEDTTPDVPEDTTPDVPEDTTPDVPEDTTPDTPEVDNHQPQQPQQPPVVMGHTQVDAPVMARPTFTG